MKNFQYGLASPRTENVRASIIIRPKSNYTISSFSQPHRQLPSLRTSREHPLHFFQPQTQPNNEYYAQQRQVVRRSAREMTSSKRGSIMVDGDAQKLQKIKNVLTVKIQKSIRSLQDQIQQQSNQIIFLQRTIQKQQKQLQTKNSIIQTLIGKINDKNSTSINAVQDKAQSIIQRRLRDFQTKVSVLMQQFQEEKEINQKGIEQLTNNVISFFGKKNNKNKERVTNFIEQTENMLEKMCFALNLLCERANLIENINQTPETAKIDLKNSSFGSVQDTCSSNRSKESLHSEKTLPRRDQSTISDYFFHPPHPDQTNILAVEQLAKERQQLPIRVFLDSQGRLKYWQSRTFLFDRKGNFTSPQPEQLLYMESQGWIKLLVQ